MFVRINVKCNRDEKIDYFDSGPRPHHTENKTIRFIWVFDEIALFREILWVNYTAVNEIAALCILRSSNVM